MSSYSTGPGLSAYEQAGLEYYPKLVSADSLYAPHRAADLLQADNNDREGGSQI